MISAQNVKNTSYAILGLGRSGLSVATALKASGAKVLCLDDNIDNLRIAEDLGFTCSVPNKIHWNEKNEKFTRILLMLRKLRRNLSYEEAET